MPVWIGGRHWQFDWWLKNFGPLELYEGVSVPTMSTLTESAIPDGNHGIGPVLLVSPWYRPSIGGIVECVDILRKYLGDAGVETSVLVVEEQSTGFRLQPNPYAENIWNLQIPSYFFYSRGFKAPLAMIRRAPATIWRVFGFLRSKRVRTVILNYPSGYSWVFLLARYLLGIRLIATYLGNDITKYKDQIPAMQWLTRRLLRNSDAVTVCSRHMLDIAQSLFPNQKLSIRLLPNCVDIHHFVPPPSSFRRSDTRPTIVHVSIFAPKKRTLDIIEAFAIADLSPETRLVMVGEGVDLPAAKELAQRRGIDHRVEFVGGQKNVRAFLWEADLFVLASEDEGAPLVLVEAMACGVPWVSTPWGVAAELPPGECGITVPCRSPKDLAAALSELMKDSDRRKSMSERARLRAELELSAEAHLTRYLRLIEEVETRKFRPQDSVQGPPVRKS